ncbi:unnamed protein product [Caenorhabditis bovis]|uniref:ABC transporter family G domain-containing protein n=1 Tax=Caenorhabditis bovis TaxID=2654633 RepID=A0A8S1F462_9PELO|nr:unnamed protein product [Caenorhabditis bovis]
MGGSRKCNQIATVNFRDITFSDSSICRDASSEKPKTRGNSASNYRAKKNRRALNYDISTKRALYPHTYFRYFPRTRKLHIMSEESTNDSIYFSTIRSRHTTDPFFTDVDADNDPKPSGKILRYPEYTECPIKIPTSVPCLTLSKLSFSRDLRSSTDKVLLRLPILKQEFYDINFELRSGDVMALMYTRESEMECLLKVIGGSAEVRGKISGEIFVNGHRMSKTRLSRTIGLVSAEMPSSYLTIRQYMVVMCSMYPPPSSKHYGGTNHLINKLMTDMGLMQVASIPCHRVNRSQWQRARIAAQLARDPAILICTDILKDIDLHDQCFLIDYVRDWALKTDRIVIMAIAATSPQLLAMFSTAMIFASGRAIYVGPPKYMQEYFESIGCPCPMYKNPCDYYVDLVTHDILTSDASRESSIRIARLINKWNQMKPIIHRSVSGNVLLDLSRANFLKISFSLLCLHWFYFRRNPEISMIFVIFMISTVLSFHFSEISLNVPQAFWQRYDFIEMVLSAGLFWKLFELAD